MKFIFYSVIAVLAIVAGVVSFRLSDQAVNPQPIPVAASEVSIKTVDVLVAKKDIAVGSVIDTSMIDKQPWPENLVAGNFIKNSDSDQNIIGKIVRSAISANEPFMKSKLANPNDPGFLAAGLPLGMRAITVATDSVSGIAGFIFPGDRVDLLFTHSAGENTSGGGRPDVTEVLASNIRVLAINVRAGNPAEAVPSSPSSITLEVADNLAQEIRLAEKNGTLSFSLRSIHDTDSIAPVPTGIEDLSNSTGSSVSVVRGPSAATGGKIVSEAVSGAGAEAYETGVTGNQENTESGQASPDGH